MEDNKQIFRTILESNSDKFYRDCQSGKYDLKFDNSPKAKESQLYNIGQVVKASGQGSIKQGYQFKIESFYCENGYYYYFGCGMYHRTKDIEL